MEIITHTNIMQDFFMVFIVFMFDIDYYKPLLTNIYSFLKIFNPIFSDILSQSLLHYRSLNGVPEL